MEIDCFSSCDDGLSSLYHIDDRAVKCESPSSLKGVEYGLHDDGAWISVSMLATLDVLAGAPVIRHTPQKPCEVCGGHPEMPRGHEVRCFGFCNDEWIHCTREERAGNLKATGAGTYAHLLGCRCTDGCTCHERGKRMPGCWCTGDCRCCRCGLTHGKEPPTKPKNARERRHDSDPTWRIRRASELWNGSARIAGTIGERYLRERGITLVPDVSELRFHAGLFHHRGAPTLPALVAPFLDAEGHFAGVERIFLAPDGSTKADVEPNKKMLGFVRGAAIRFGGIEDLIGLTEGPENALSVRQATGVPVWAAGALNFLSTVVLPEVIRRVVIYADPKSHEIRGAEEAARRLIAEGRDARVAYPPDGLDANDSLRKR